jgi:hypothetical protein
MEAEPWNDDQQTGKAVREGQGHTLLMSRVHTALHRCRVLCLFGWLVGWLVGGARTNGQVGVTRN